MKTVVLDCQSLLDIAIQELGDISGIFDLAEKSGVSLTDELQTGRELELPLQLSDKQIAGYYASRRITPATAITIDSTSDGGELLLEGVEFWGIEYDFIVSGENGTVN